MANEPTTIMRTGGAAGKRRFFDIYIRSRKTGAWRKSKHRIQASAPRFAAAKAYRSKRKAGKQVAEVAVGYLPRGKYLHKLRKYSFNGKTAKAVGKPRNAYKNAISLVLQAVHAVVDPHGNVRSKQSVARISLKRRAKLAARKAKKPKSKSKSISAARPSSKSKTPAKKTRKRKTYVHGAARPRRTAAAAYAARSRHRSVYGK
jgi:hypothetical protein